MKKIKLNVLNANHELVRSYTTEFNDKEGTSFEIDIIDHTYCFDDKGEIFLEIKKKDETKKD